MRFIDEHRDRYAVALLLRVLDVTASTYYGWVQQAVEPCDRDLVDLWLLSNIYEIWEAPGRTYGTDRVHRQLLRDGIRVGRHISRPRRDHSGLPGSEHDTGRVRRLVSDSGISGLPPSDAAGSAAREVGLLPLYSRFPCTAGGTRPRLSAAGLARPHPASAVTGRVAGSADRPSSRALQSRATSSVHPSWRCSWYRPQ